MNVVVQIQGRDAIPVRAIPLLTNWHFMSPDVIVHVLGGTEGSNVSLFGNLHSYHFENGMVQPITKDWWVQFPLLELKELSEKLKAIGTANRSEWINLSLKALPAGAFVWKDDYQKLHEKNWNSRFSATYCALKSLHGEQTENQCDWKYDDSLYDPDLNRDLIESLEVLKRWRVPDYSPFIHKELSDIVMEGFSSGDEPPTPAPKDVKTDVANISIIQMKKPTGELKPNTGRMPGYRWPLHQFLQKAYDERAKSCPNARDVIIAWTHKPPDGIEVSGDFILYESTSGNEKKAGIDAVID
jgi:hypothetical protein